ncbi:MAG TPA: Stp1/IreP family PP2C-type Ser/Thr phosphatase [Ktedonobacteraceae bacterium]|nr:Stp1/IreP family PP2C-type Ser/Thr phosphatase [Ktedonobacteraceae bacterium]
MSNQLRLDVAQLTDVGRKREHNEDNMAYVIPKDEQVMATKGALFIVADGMGGHAAGEVASEIAVDTVSNTYYMDDNIDVAAPLLQAIKRANAAIHQRAAENMLRSGMGTTCVAAVLRGNVAYIANVGDSRAYLVRQGQVRQISLDHSWVAEQVRANLLTEEQARTHAQRNVITRSLGTQPDVDVDLFREQLQPGDYLVLCSDGLSGLISDEELKRTVEQSVPQESVYHLVERANENGGPDNITAIVVQVQEVGVEPPGVRNPVLVGGREVSDEETIAMNMISGPARNAVSSGHYISGPLRLSSGPLASPDSVTAPQPALSRMRRSRLFFPTLLLIFLLIVALAGGGVFYVLHLNQSQAISQSLTNANQSITQAAGLTSGSNPNPNPAQALMDLSSAQKTLQNIQQNQLDSSQSSNFKSLQNQLVIQTNQAIKAYNSQASIFPLSCYGYSTSVLNLGNNNTQAASVAAVQNGRSTVLFALGSDGALYRLNGPSVVPSSTSSKILAIASDGKQLFLLNEQINNSVPAYSVSVYSFNPSGSLGQPQSIKISQSLITGGFTPLPFISAWGNHVYVAFNEPVASNGSDVAHIVSYAPDKTGQLAASQPFTISVSHPISSVAAFPTQFFLLLADGEVLSFPLDAAFGTQTNKPPPAPVQVQAPIQTPLPVAGQFTQATSVPTPTATQPATSGIVTLTVPNAAQLAVGVVSNTTHLYIGDSSNHRVIDLVVASSTGTSVTMKLIQQYVSAQLLNKVESIAVDPGGATMYLLDQVSAKQISLISVSTALQSGCGTGI